MSKANPRKAMAALLPTPIKVGDVEVKPMTLAMYAALERIGSPLVTGVDAKDMIEIIPSAYLLTHGAKEIFRGNLMDLAMSWADTVPVGTLERIKDACYRQIKAVQDVIPEGEEKKKRPTAGLPTSSTGHAQNTDGRTGRPCSRCRSRRSSSCNVRKDLR